MAALQRFSLNGKFVRIKDDVRYPCNYLVGLRVSAKFILAEKDVQMSSSWTDRLRMNTFLLDSFLPSR